MFYKLNRIEMCESFFVYVNLPGKNVIFCLALGGRYESRVFSLIIFNEVVFGVFNLWSFLTIWYDI